VNPAGRYVLIRSARIFFPIFIGFLILSAAGSWSQQKSLESLTAEEWTEDLKFMASELSEKHKNLFFKLPEEKFSAMVEDLRSRIPGLSPEEIIVGFMKILAAVGDAHTDTYIRPAQALPLMIYWFDDGLFILNTTERYKAAFHGRITGLGGHPIEKVIEALSQVIPHENDAQIKNKLPSLLTRTDLLFGLGLLSDTSGTDLSFLDREGVEKTIKMEPISMSVRPAWLADLNKTEDAPLYRQRAGEFYWHHFLEESGTLFVKYNSCRNIPGRPFSEFTKEVFEFLDNHDTQRLIIDLRHNGGGNSAIFSPFIGEIKKRDSINQKGRLFVLIGRRTFSSAVLNALELQNQTEAIFAGEPTGGKPNHFGEIKYFELPHSKLPVQYSTKYFTIAAKDTPSLMPDIPVEVNFSHYLSNSDPVLEAVLEK
jgi:hypothetical protein